MTNSKRELLSERKLEGYLKLANIIQWGRNNPIGFVETFLGIQLLDFQKYAFLMSWEKPFVLWVMSRNAGKTTLAAPFIMAKSILFNNFQTYILAGTGRWLPHILVIIYENSEYAGNSLEPLLATFTGNSN